MFSYEVFQCEEFIAFTEELNHAINSTTPPAEVEIQCVAPEINSRISDLALQIQSLYRASGSHNTISNEIIEAISSNVVKKMEEKFSNSLGIYMQPSLCINPTDNVVVNTTASARRRGREDEEDNPRKRYKLSRDLPNVNSLWKEWSVGLAQGKPRINSLNEEYGSKWRQDSKERKYYSKRLVIINEIRKISEERSISLEDAAQAVENERISLQGCSLDKLSKVINSRNKQQ
ncbi:hypothetical protein INT45_006358 [Circinella minor]|uniref:Transcription activator GCR1-like domain-containing protein n=1 Tax=Circinella minor TaxID=1195481 RepID=A0A8H7RGL9_9FUNG|nr:hypothetical protein INT45_006358 [Circinella minor]